MFIHSGNPIIHHLLMMSKTLEDINTHLKNSFVFASRIRWSTPEGLFAVNGPTGLQRQTMPRGTAPTPAPEEPASAPEEPAAAPEPAVESVETSGESGTEDISSISVPSVSVG
jgi:hypothetical protein